MQIRNSISKKEMLEAIKRSGYLFESEISSQLVKKGFWLQPNKIIKDAVTGKSREIDLIAATLDADETILYAIASIEIVFEIKNNIYPLVLMTKAEFPQSEETWGTLKQIAIVPDGIDWDYILDGFSPVMFKDRSPIFNQYCSFSMKKGNKELMASHPEVIYSGLLKITQYCEEQVESRKNSNNAFFFSNNLYLPVLLLKGDLFELYIDHQGEPELKKTDESKLLFNYYFKGAPKISTIIVLTQKGFDKFIKRIIKIEKKMKSKMLSRRGKGPNQ